MLIRARRYSALGVMLGALVAGTACNVCSAAVLCPNGQYVNTGPCTLCPDGSYIGGGGRCTLAPDGKYVNGTPRLTPNGGYVGGNGPTQPQQQPTTLCPDGSYVAGKTCVLMPNGRYIGK